MSVTTHDLESVLSRFGLSQFRSGQREVIEAILSGRDVLCVMPTGGGKSLCYQLPALCLPGLTLVVSPLVALIKDQEDRLLKLGLPVTSLHGGLELAEQRDRLDRIAAGEYSIAFVAPERFRSSRFVEAVRKVGISLLAVDEAHCISEWGHDFRPDYARLGWFRQQLGSPPTVALTATATDIVRRDIAVQLRLNDPQVFIRGFDRPNLSYWVRLAASKAQKLTSLKDILADTPGSVIIYTSSRKSCDEVAPFLRERCGRRVAVYHAGMMHHDRKRAQDDFMSSRAEVVVATNAFGMGIDKPDIRAVIHYNLPGTLEAYYQEAGRAGRDGLPARCELLFSPADRIIQEYFIESEYPDADVVYQVLAMLRSSDDDLVEWTRTEMKDRLGGRISEMAVATCLKILEGAGVLERLKPRDNMAIIRIHETGPDLTDLLPTSAKTQRRVLKFLQGIVGNQRGEDCYFSPDRAATALEIERSSLVHAIGEIAGRMSVDYIPPFRGSATRLLDRATPARQLPIDFEQLRERKEGEYAKLERVIDFAQLAQCRRAALLEYFGDEAQPCGNCDFCQSSGKGKGATGTKSQAGTAAKTAVPEVMDDAAVAVVQKVLAGVAELRGRFGKILIAQVIAGSNNQKTSRFGLNKKECFGSVTQFRQVELQEIIDALLMTGLCQQEGDARRPVVNITPRGVAVLNGESNLPPTFPLSPPLLIKLATFTNQRPSTYSAPKSHDSDSRTWKPVDTKPERPRQERVEPKFTPAASPPPVRSPSRESSSYPSKSPSSPPSRETNWSSTNVAQSGRSSPTPPARQAPPRDLFSSAEPATRSERDHLPYEIEGRKGAAIAPTQRPAHVWAADLLNKGFSVADCLAIRRIGPDEFLGHLVRGADEGLQFPFAPVAEAYGHSSYHTRISEIKQRLGADRTRPENPFLE